MTVRRSLVGFVHRVVYATLFALLAWHACTWPFDSRVQRRVATAVCYTLDFPTAIIGHVTSPYRGIDVFFDRGGEWCDFCPAQQVLWNHVRFAVPVYVVLFYVPTLVLWMVRKWRSKANRKHVAEAESPGHA